MIRIRMPELFFSSGYPNFSAAKNITLLDVICSQHFHARVLSFCREQSAPGLLLKEVQGLCY